MIRDESGVYMRLHDIAKGAKTTIKGTRVISDQELKGLQRVLLVILDDMLTVLNEEHLTYVFIAGSAIGAVRHNGFIPWDDDIDIAMPRKDYEIFKRSFQKKFKGKYEILDPQVIGSEGIISSKVCLLGTEYKTFMEGFRTKHACIYIDIFIIENVPNNAIARTFEGGVAVFLKALLSCKRQYDRRADFSLLYNTASRKLRSAVGCLLSFASIETWARWVDNWNRRCKDENSSFVTIPSDGKHYFGEMLPRRSLCQVTKKNFEGRTVCLPKDYDVLLTNKYGDYMKVPDNGDHVQNICISFDLGKYGDGSTEQ